MKIIILNFLFILLTIKLINSLNCPQYQSKRTCECRVTYAIGDQEPYSRKLFDLPSYDDCGFNIGCEKLDCATNCLKSVRKILGGREDFITELAKQKVCELISPLQPVRSGIQIWASWKYDICRSGHEPVVQDICCNRKCNCKLVGQKVKEFNERIDTIVDFKQYLPQYQIAYDCSVSELGTCQTDCLEQISNYFNNPNLKNLNSKILNYNIFSDKFSSRKICEAIDDKISKPGIDVYVDFDTEKEKKYVQLGRVCCKKMCNCEYIFKKQTSGDELKPSFPVQAFEEENLGYECSDELNDCISFCRRQAFQLISAFDLNLNLNTSTVDIDTLKYNVYSKYACELINIRSPGDIEGYNFYLRYTSNNNYFPYREDLHLGRLCCRKGLGQLYGVNRCNSTNT